MATKKPIWKGPKPLMAHLLPIADLMTDPRNARAHPQRSIDAIKASFERFGQVKPVVADSSGMIIAGNGGLAAATALGWTHLAVVRVLMTDEEARAYAIVDNRSAELSEWNPGELVGQLQELNPAAKLAVGFNDAEMAGLLERVNAAQVVTDALAHWTGMPEFNQGDTRAHQTVTVNFRDPAAVEAFVKALGVAITPKTKSLWYPAPPAPVIDSSKAHVGDQPPVPPAKAG